METETSPKLDRFASDREKFLSMGGEIGELKPCVNDFSPNYSIDGQYVFMGLWAFNKIRALKPKRLYDVGGEIRFLAYLREFVPVEHIDIRDCGLYMPNFTFKRGDITDLPYADNSLDAVSCLHVAEHIGLGRYGDKIDPGGFDKACAELVRVLKPGGRLFFAVPMGRPRVVFNAHRVIGPGQLLDAMAGLKMLDFAQVNTGGLAFEHSSLDSVANEEYACGMAEFTK